MVCQLPLELSRAIPVAVTVAVPAHEMLNTMLLYIL